MIKYQLGTASIDSTETVVIRLSDSIYRLSQVLVFGDAKQFTVETGLSGMLNDWTTWRDRIQLAVEAVGEQQDALQKLLRPIPQDQIAWLPPLRRPRKLICMGTNYAGHAKEVASEPLKASFSFIKPTSNTLRGSGDTITLLDTAQMNDWEVELAVVIGSAARAVSEADALGYVAGYMIMNDVSSRDWVAESPKFLGVDWVVGKAADGYAPMGPWLTPAEFVPDPQNLNIGLTLNGETMQDGNTSEMVFTVAQVIAHLSRTMTLEPGDIIATGTPEGTGFGHKPPIFLKHNDVARCTIEGLGVLENRFVRHD